ncbi:MAG: flagellar biosynthesis protein FliQ [Myxococcales bacterium]|nr:flagellar biosynthesis protein FliQ [Myxococcales bacterium]
MSTEIVLAWGHEALLTALLLGGPLLLTALVVGTVVSVLQAVTQVQEMTLVFVPKMLSVGVVVLLAGGWMLQTAVAFATRMFESIPG